MEARNIFGENIGEIKTKFLKVTEDGYSPTLAIVFCSAMQDRKALVEFFNEVDVDVFGSTTAGEVLDTEIMEFHTVIMLLNLSRENYKLFCEASPDTYKISNDLGKFAKSLFDDPSIILVSSGLIIDAEQIIKGIKDFDSQIPLYGGLAGDDLTMKASFVFSNKYESSTGLVALIIDNKKVKITGLATSGWDNIGVEKTITRSEGNVVFTIDDEPAVDVFVKFFQFTDSIYNRSEIVAMNFAQYPLQLKKENGNIVLRSPLMVDFDKKALIFAGGIPQGSKVQFSVPPGFDLIDKTRDSMSVLKKIISTPDAVILFSCKARHLALGPIMEDEAGKIKDIWNKPLIGFFTYGEIGTAKDGVCDFHNATCSLVLLEEKK